MSKVMLRKVGSRYVATIPAQLVQELKLSEGQKLQASTENGRIVLTPVRAELEEVMRAYARVSKRYRSALRKLADA